MIDVLMIAIAALIAVLLLGVEHYWPWRPMLGRSLGNLECYVAGVLALVLPMSGLLAIWGRWVELAALWAIVAAGGLAVIGMYALDSWLTWRARAHVSEEIEGRLHGAIDE